MTKSFKRILQVLLFVVSLSLVVYGQKQIGYAGLAMELVGLFGLIACLWMYNQAYK